MEKGYPKVVWLFVFVCVQKRRTRGAGARKPRPFPDARPDWPAAAPPASTRAAPEASARGAPEGRRLADLAALPGGFASLPLRSPFVSRFFPVKPDPEEEPCEPAPSDLATLGQLARYPGRSRRGPNPCFPRAVSLGRTCCPAAHLCMDISEGNTVPGKGKAAARGALHLGACFCTAGARFPYWAKTIF